MQSPVTALVVEFYDITGFGEIALESAIVSSTVQLQRFYGRAGADLSNDAGSLANASAAILNSEFIY